MTSELEQLEKTIAALEAQRAILGEDVVETALAPLRQKLAALQTGESTRVPVEESSNGGPGATAPRRGQEQVDRGETDLVPSPALSQQDLSGEGQTLVEQRKLVTVLFADLVDFTALGEQLDPEDVREIVNAYFSGWRSSIEKFGGLVEKFIGDAVMAVFGLPTAREDDPENAIRAALAMESSLESLNEDLQRTRGLRLAMRVGIHTGPVVVSYLGERKGQDVVVVGDTVNLTSRLQAAAPPGGILISHDTYRHVRGVFDMQVLEPVKVKGKRDPVRVYLALRAKPRAFRNTNRGVEGIETHMVGREAELKRLQEALYAAIEDRELQMLAVIGEAGIGKSRLLAEFDNWAELLPERLRYFKGRATAAMQNQANSLLRDLFSFRFQIQESDSPQVVWEKMERGILELGAPGMEHEADDPGGRSQIADREAETIMRVHFIGQLLGFDFSHSPHLSGLLGGEARADYAKQVRDRALVYLVDFFKTLSDQGPVVILIEDLHWADDSSIELLVHLARSLAAQPILVLCAARRSLFDRRPEWSQIEQFRSFLPTYSRIDLQPLTRRDTRKLVEEVLQKLGRVPGELRDLVVNSAEGNPFYVEELVKMLIEEGVILKDAGDEHWQVDLTRLAGVHIPPTLTGVLQARFDSLPSAEKLLLQRASVIGRIFWDDAVAALGRDWRLEIRDLGHGTNLQSRRSPDEETGFILKNKPANAISNLLIKLRNREMIYHRERSAFEETQEYLFKHALLRDVTYESLLKRERRVYHLHAAQWLEWVTQRSRRSDEYASLIAEHYDQAAEPGQAAAWYLKAGKRAASQYANAQAVRLLSRALELTPVEEAGTRFEILLAREKVYSLQGRREAQAQEHGAMAVLAKQVDDDMLRAETALRRSMLGEATGEYSQAVEYAREAVDLAQRAGNVEKAANGYLVWGSALWKQADYAPASVQFERALQLSQEHGLHGFEADALRSLGIVHEVQSDYPRAREYLERSLDLYRKTGDRRGESMSLNSLGVLVFHQGDLARGRELLGSALRLKREFGDRYSEGITLANLAIVAYHQGDIAGAQDYFERCLKICREIDDREGEATALNGLGTLAMYRGDYSQARDYIQAGLVICQKIGDRQGESGSLATLAQLCLQIRDYEQARDYSQQALAVSEETESRNEQGYALIYLGHALHGLGKPNEALDAYERAFGIRQELGQSDLILDGQAGMARVELGRGELTQATALVGEILSYLAGHPNAGMDDPGRVYLTCIRVLEAAGDPRAQSLVEIAYAWLQERAAKIQEEARASFLQNVPANREIVAEWEKRTYEE